MTCPRLHYELTKSQSIRKSEQCSFSTRKACGFSLDTPFTHNIRRVRFVDRDVQERTFSADKTVEDLLNEIPENRDKFASKLWLYASVCVTHDIDDFESPYDLLHSFNFLLCEVDSLFNLIE